MQKLIIGIHGLANKPDKAVLKQWWETSLKEGLKKNTSGAVPSFKFEMVHWADLLYKNEVHDDVNFDFDKLYNDEPYIKALNNALKPYDDSWKDKVRSAALEAGIASLDKLGISKLADWVIEKVLKDLDFYYDDKRKILNRKKTKKELAFKVLKDELKNCINANNNHEIMLIAHSMGTIISYDVLRDIGRIPNNTITIKDFITIGSPLGIPYVKQKIIAQRTYNERKNRVRTPTIITESWTNFSDKKDPVAIDSHLRDDYKANKTGVRVVDDLVLNDYVGLKGKRNHHKSYGYLRTPELSKRVLNFLK